MTDKTKDEMVQEIYDRMVAMPVPATEEQIKKMVSDQFASLAGDKEFVRKMRFGGDAEPKLVGSKFSRWRLSASDIEFLFDLMLAVRGQIYNGASHPGPSEELNTTFGAISDAIYLPADKVRELDKRALDNVFPRIPKVWLSERDQKLAGRGAWEQTDAYQRATRAMDTAETGFGLQLIGTQYVAELWEAARRESRIFNLLDTFEMSDPTAFLPVEVDIPEMSFVAESLVNPATAYASVKTGSQRVQVDAKKFLIHQMWSGEMEEDSIVPFVGFLRRQAQLALSHYSDSVALNGDTTNAATGNINSDDDDPVDTKFFLAFDGIRHAGLVDNTGNSKDLAGAIGYAALVASKGRMIDSTRFVDWGHPVDPMELVYISDPETADQIGNFDEVVKSLQLRNRPLLNGEIGDILGHPIVGSLAMGKTEADGKISFDVPSNNIKGQVAAFNRRGFKVGWRRRVKIETERLPATDQTRLVYSMRMGFGRFSPSGAASGIEAADVLYNITLP